MLDESISEAEIDVRKSGDAFAELEHLKALGPSKVEELKWQRVEELDRDTSLLDELLGWQPKMDMIAREREKDRIRRGLRAHIIETVRTPTSHEIKIAESEWNRSMQRLNQLATIKKFLCP